MGNAVFKTSGLKKIEEELSQCEQKNKSLTNEMNILKTKIENLKETEVVSINKNECKQKISYVREELTSALKKEGELKKEVLNLQKKLKTVEKEKEGLKKLFAVNDTNLKTQLDKEQENSKKLIEVLKAKINVQNKEINTLKINENKNGKVAARQKEEYSKLLRQCDEKVKEISLSSAEHKKQLGILTKNYNNIQNEYKLLSKYKNFTVNNETKTITISPENRYSLKINHVDVHPTGYGKITYYFVDGKSDTFKFTGNGGLTFKNSKNVSKTLRTGNHGLELKDHLGLSHTYTIICSSVTGVNTWEFKSLSGVKKIVLEEKSQWAGLKDITLSRDTATD